MNSQPSIENAAIEPALLMPGSVAVLTVDLSDRFGIVDRVVGHVKQDPSITFRLRDDGVAPDEAEADGVWTFEYAVPFTAPPGAFDLVISAQDSAGDLILVRDGEGEARSMATELGVEIRFPETQ
ncbi:MAG: hypothetical protein QGG73_05830 [Candidatus Hydrogenedentes bacterium]|jgi:hypothetical protein|nr:hypothetical protein [Candidatus Hydrogenedentota bacterium]